MEHDLETVLARKLLAGEAGAFDEFVAHFRSRIFQYSWLMCGQREDAEEVAQETLLSVFENLNQLRDAGRVRPWVFRIARNACLTRRRRSVFAPPASQEIPLDGLMPKRDGAARLEIADWSSLPEDEAIRAELRRHLESAIRQLPELYRATFLLRDAEGLSTAETAQILEVSEEVVKTRLHRARLMLRQHLDTHLRAREATHAA